MGREKAKSSATIVFVVDDEDGLRTSMEEFLEDNGYLVLTARNGVEALERMRGIVGRAVAVVDMRMPVMDGSALIDAMTSHPELSRIPVVVLSGHVQTPVRGAAAVLKKPYVPAELLAAIERVQEETS